jgi:hypothetical protein
MASSRSGSMYAELFDSSDTLSGRPFPSDDFCADLYIDDPPPAKRQRVIRLVINHVPKPVARLAFRDGIVPRRMAPAGTDPDLPAWKAARSAQQFPSTPLPGSEPDVLARSQVRRTNTAARTGGLGRPADRGVPLWLPPALVGFRSVNGGGLASQNLDDYIRRQN